MTPPSLRSRLSSAQVPAAALLPLRFFLGATFLYAGLDKLLDPRFFDPGSGASIQAQFQAFERVSPLAPLIRLGEPYAVEIGLLIALAEIAIGLGAVTGILYRASAFAGALLAILFWLTASWATRPYYIGPDLPFAVGWLSLALAGHGGLLVPRRLVVPSAPAVTSRKKSRTAPPEQPRSPERRALLQAGLLALGALVVAALAAPVRLLGSAVTATPQPTQPTGALDSPTPSRTPLPTGTTVGGQGSPSPPGAPASPPPGIVVANVADLDRSGSFAFRVPFRAPAPLPAGDPAVIVKLSDGTFVAYDAVCTHEGCTVEWDRIDAVLVCPCHGAVFDAAHRARVLAGPTNVPLASLPIVVDASSGTISLRV